MQTGADGIYAIGDLNGPQERHYSHLSSEGAIIAAENAMGLKQQDESPDLYPRFSSPSPRWPAWE